MKAGNGWLLATALALATLTAVTYWPKTQGSDDGRSKEIGASLGPALTPSTFAAIPDGQLLEQVLKECWRQILLSGSVSALSQKARALWTVEVLEGYVLQAGFGALCLQESTRNPQQATISDLAQAYRELRLDSLARIVDEAATIANEKLQTITQTDQPFTEAALISGFAAQDQRFRSEVAQVDSVGQRIAFARRNRDAILLPGR